MDHYAREQLPHLGDHCARSLVSFVQQNALPPRIRGTSNLLIHKHFDQTDIRVQSENARCGGKLA